MKKSVATMFIAAGFASMIALGGLASADDTPASAPSAQQDAGHCKQKGAHFLKRLAKQLNLSDQQVAQIKASFEKRHSTMKPLMVSLHSEKKELRTLVMSGNADEAAIRAQSAKVAAAEADLAVARAQGAKEMMAILNPDQQAKFKTLREKWETKGMKGMKGHCGKGPHHD
jgi:Spy/CpxP family protein refolding chaperone